MIKQKAKPNYERKAKAISEGYTTLERKLSLEIWKKTKSINLDSKQFWENGVINDDEIVKEFHNYINMYHTFMDDDLFIEAKKVNRASYVRKERLSNRIQSMILKGSCIFLTLTFDDVILSSTNEQTRRKYVQRFLKLCSYEYVANIDYGRKNEREHYHAIVLAEKVNHNLWHKITYSNSAINFERIRNTSDNVKLANYVCKLTNHAIKETTKRCHTIYSRKIK